VTRGKEFTWEARGIKGKPGGATTPSVQKGSFQSVAGEQGEVHFPHRYESPPNVELTGSRKTIVVESSASGFKWKNASNEKNSADGPVTWVAKGIKAK
jgi:hypothetical protein